MCVSLCVCLCVYLCVCVCLVCVCICVCVCVCVLGAKEVATEARTGEGRATDNAEREGEGMEKLGSEYRSSLNINSISILICDQVQEKACIMSHMSDLCL